MDELNVAIVGAGPSAFFVAERLLQSKRRISVSIIERLPVPFGLIRYGVAPDHQTTKNVATHFQSILDDERVHFFGHVHVGRDVSLNQLRDLFDAVVIATGASKDRTLGVPGCQLHGVHAASEIVGWYNGHPDFAGIKPDLNVERVLIVGLGNVALDLARIFAKPVSSLRESDLPIAVREELSESRIKEITIAGRKGPKDAKFTNPELREFGRIDGLGLSVSGIGADELSDDPELARGVRRNLKAFAGFAGENPGERRKLQFQFNAAPSEIGGIERVQFVSFTRSQEQGSMTRWRPSRALSIWS